jgi:hypothetical protein
MAHMARYDVYGIKNGDLEETALFINNVLGISLAMRDSLYRGIYYCDSIVAGSEYLLRTNTPEYSEWHTEAPGYGLLLFVSDLPDMDTISKKLLSSRDDLALLKSKSMMVDDDDDEE